nr:hypothetical protein [Catellatospora sichuanensis]
MQETVEPAGCGDVFGQEPAPLLEGPMAGDAQGAFVCGAHEPEQQ